MSKFFDELMSDYRSETREEKNIIDLGFTEIGTKVSLGMSEMGHTLISGMSRSGKTRMAKGMMKSISQFADVAIYSPKMADYVEFEDTALVSSNIDEFGELIRLTVGTMERRNESQLNKSRIAGESVRCTDSPVLIVIDEFAGFSLALDDGSRLALNKIIAEGAGLNVFLMLITQVASKKVLSDGLKDNMMTIIAFKARDQYASRMAIGSRKAEFLRLGQAIVMHVDKQYTITKYAS